MFAYCQFLSFFFFFSGSFHGREGEFYMWEIKEGKRFVAMLLYEEGI